MRIVLIRHGRPELVYPAKIYANEMKEVIAAYDAAGLNQNEHPPNSVVSVAKKCDFIVCSDLLRALNSVQWLGLKPDLTDSLFRELQLPFPDRRLIKLRPYTWSTVLRILWFFGYSNHSESLYQAKKRAFLASQRLIKLAEKHHSVALIGHGFMNRFIARVLRLKGWLGPPFSGRKFWSMAIYEHSEARGQGNNNC